MDLSVGTARIPVECVPVAALGLPLSPHLLGIHAAGGRALRRAEGSVDGFAPVGALPSVSSRRVRSRPVTLLCTKVFECSNS